MHAPFRAAACAVCIAWSFAGGAFAQEVAGTLTVNGKSAPLKFAVAKEAFIRWNPSAYDEKRVAGRFWTDGTQNAFQQRWSYDVTFSAPITLDPEARTVPNK